MTSLIPAGVLPPVKTKCAEVVAAVPGITHVWGYAAKPDHNNRRCIDFMTPTKEIGDAVASYLTRNWVRLGVRVVIWWGQIWRSYDKLSGSRSPGRAFKWAPYNEADKHKDHPHCEFNGQPYVAPSAPVTRPQVWLDRLVPGVTDSDSVRLVERALGLEPTGNYDARVLAAVKARQIQWGDDPQYCNGVLGPKQALRLFETAAIAVTIRTDPSGQAPAQPTPPKETTPVETFTVAYGNVLRRTDSLAGRLRWALRVGNIAKAFLSVDPDVIIAVELDKTSAASLGDKLGPDWTWWRLGRGYGPLAIYWREGGKFSRPGGATTELELGENRWLLSLLLKHASGQDVVFSATHLENDGDPATDGHEARYRESRRMGVETDANHAVRQVFGGDLNSTTPSTAKATPRQRAKPRPQLREHGWTGFLTERIQLGYATHHGGKGAKPKGPAIDELGWRGLLTLLHGGLIDTSRTRCSDHHFLWARFHVDQARETK